MMELVFKGGWAMAPLLLCSLTSVTVSVERWLFFRRQAAPQSEAQALSLLKQHQLSQAETLSRQKASPLLRVLAAGLEESSHAAKAMEAASLAEIAHLKQGLPILDTIITISPLLGLLGTILGMIESFQIMAGQGLSQPHAVTGGVAEALIATAAGITIAATTLLPYNYFLSRVEAETTRLEQAGTLLELALSANPKEGAAHETAKKYA
ncbi:MotA/TolQ/ExbB proton channel family protein [Anaeroarcus burkinensis]|uniref:MotA/TolQ/ExbB proton channel family protein n=1 Tax=Anaeroarcus burkinensis TaxID=82376 RepID=UPI000405D912|nr:MotA/TolQ/ExbB proton channel family protein [Anaeroarcus burkinensis]